MPASRTTVATTMMRRHGSVPSGSRAVLLPSHHPAARAGRSIFPSRVFDPDELPALLKSGHNSRKIGRQVTKGPCKGQPIYTLTLEERASCPRSCREWLGCYGNNMQAAERVVHAPPPAGVGKEWRLARESLAPNALALAPPRPSRPHHCSRNTTGCLGTS